MSTLVLPEPALAQGATARRAHQLFLSGRTHAAQEHWPHAAKAFAQAADLSRDTAYALERSPCVDQGGARRRCGVAAARVAPRAPAAHARLHARVARLARRRPRRRGRLRAAGAAAAGGARSPLPRVAGGVAAAAQAPRRRGAGVSRRAGAEDGRRAVALSHGHVVQGARPQGRGRRVRAHRAGARARLERAVGARAVAVPRARGLPMGSGRWRTRHLARRGAGRAGPRRGRDRCLRARGGGGRRAGAAQGRRAVRRPCRRTRSAAAAPAGEGA